jgi:hypothetical protein
MKSLTDSAEPRRAKLRIDRVEPSSAKSNTDIDAPRRLWPKMENAAPSLAKDLRES